MQLTGPQLKRLHPLLLRAFPTYKELKRLALFGLDLNLDTIVGTQDLNAASSTCSTGPTPATATASWSPPPSKPTPTIKPCAPSL